MWLQTALTLQHWPAKHSRRRFFTSCQAGQAPGSRGSGPTSASSPLDALKPPLAILGAIAVGAAVPTLARQIFGRGGRGGGSGVGGGGGNGGVDGGRSGQAGQAAGREDEKKKKPPPLVTLTLVSFSTTRKAYERITARFAREYQAATGQPVRFRLSFGGSGTQARAVVDGLPGDIVALALPLDIMKIAEAGLINADWQKRVPNNAVVAESVVAIVTRHGNPKNIRGWDDLIRPDVEVITANPKTAGVARWNFLALWGHRMGKGDAAAEDFVTKVFERVPVQPRDAREASDVFYKQGNGDALLNYENEVFFTNQAYSAQDALPYVAPQHNVRVQTPVAIVDKNVDQRSVRTRAATRAAAEAFVDYLFTPEAQADFVAVGFRSIDKKMAKRSKLPKVGKAWTVEGKLGSWGATQDKFFAGQGVLDRIQRRVGETKAALRLAAKAQRRWCRRTQAAMGIIPDLLHAREWRL
ncbi:hypothetical protein WJX81_003983 [Elliptochloris bilobata]|uniref:Sulfate-binding protein n=1 Tax=Elliptochloris bilobata TaxID=381761 RepID=A0AAW1QIP5_9CHLO